MTLAASFGLVACFASRVQRYQNHNPSWESGRFQIIDHACIEIQKVEHCGGISAMELNLFQTLSPLAYSIFHLRQAALNGATAGVSVSVGMHCIIFFQKTRRFGPRAQVPH